MNDVPVTYILAERDITEEGREDTLLARDFQFAVRVDRAGCLNQCNQSE